MEFENKYGYPIKSCEETILNALEKNKIKSSIQVFYRGSMQELPVIEVPIELPLYRINNIRTRNLQKEWLVNHPDIERTFFTNDPYSILTQETQHSILWNLVRSDKNILTEFEKSKQTEPIICSDNGIVVNGNRRLCVWREYYYRINPDKYCHFQVVRIAVLPDHDEKSMYDLEIQLQVKPDIKAPYAWHAIASDCYDQMEKGIPADEIARKQGKRGAKEVNELVECYTYAMEFLEKNNWNDQWSKVDDKFYAFQSAVSSRKKINDSGKKLLFEEIVSSILQVPAKGDRLYHKIPEVEKNIDRISEKLKQTFNIERIQKTDDLDLLTDEYTSEEDYAAITRELKKNSPQIIVQVVETAIDEANELEKEKKKNGFVFDQVFKASTALKQAVIYKDNERMSKDGIKKQLDSIEVSLEVLKSWIEEKI